MGHQDYGVLVLVRLLRIETEGVTLLSRLKGVFLSRLVLPTIISPSWT
jgi:hypothetical protein